jgi:tyrosinase
MDKNIKIRKSITELQSAYDAGNKKPLEDLMRAWKGIKELPADDPNSFFMLGGFHGEPFRGAGWGNNQYWGGYCNHGNVLFPTWHRVYLLKLEEALQSIAGCSEVMLPYWDETSEDSLTKGIPSALTDETFVLDGKVIPNPLKSFIFPQNIVDNISGDNPNYSKPAGYKTVRYPLSGLVGTPQDIQNTKIHNGKFPDPATNVALLNKNIIEWLNSGVTINGKFKPTNVAKAFKDCLNAPNYTVFSNTTSAAEWNSKVENASTKVVPLESPHNSIHLAVGGFEIPHHDYSPIDGANGDMGENDTAGLDPIFYFHHCNVDRVFWLWQKKNGHTKSFDIIPEYPGTNTVDSQGPTPGMAPNSWLTMESPLNPFKLSENGNTRPYNSYDCVNIIQMGYDYSKGSLEEEILPSAKLESAENGKKLIKITGINKAPVNGSFLISAFAQINGKREHLGTEAVLARWNSKYCANCQTHLEARAFFDLPEISEHSDLKLSEIAQTIEVEVKGRKGLISGNVNNMLLKSDGSPAIKYKVEVI